MRVAITGATGLIGQALAESLVRDGHAVHRLTRAPRRTGAFAFDPDSGTIAAGAFDAVDAVVHLAGEPVAQRWTDDVRDRIRASRVRGTQLVAEALAGMTHPPRVLVSGSAVGIYGDRGDEVLTDESAAGDGFLAEVCVAWEATAEPARVAGIRVAHPRTGIVLAEDGGALGRMLLPFRLGLGGRIGSGRQWMSWISLRDAVAGIRYIIDHEALAGGVNLVGPTPVTNAEFTRALAAALHRPALFPVPAFALRLAFSEMADATLMASQRAMPGALQRAGFAFADRRLESALESVVAG